MHESREHLQTLTEIRSLMERSSKFLSLSGLSGVSAGVIALAGAVFVSMRLHTGFFYRLIYSPGAYIRRNHQDSQAVSSYSSACCVGCRPAVGQYFTVRKARRQGQSCLESSSKRLLWAMAVPLATGGIFCLALLLVQPDLAGFSGYTYFLRTGPAQRQQIYPRDVESLAYCEIGLGLLSLFWPGYNLLTWAIGFGLLHIVYGLAMYYKYERTTA